MGEKLAEMIAIASESYSQMRVNLELDLSIE